MSARTYRRDRLGRFAGAGSKVASAATVARAATRTGARKVVTATAATARESYVAGSFTKNLEVGRLSGSYKGVNAGAEFRSPAGRGVLVKGTVGYHGTPTRRLDVTPSLNKAQKKVTVTARPNPASRSASSGRKLRK